MTRRVVSLVWLCLLVSLGLLAAASVAAQEPLRLGVLTIRSGPIASCGCQIAAPVYSRDYPPAKNIE